MKSFNTKTMSITQMGTTIIAMITSMRSMIIVMENRKVAQAILMIQHFLKMNLIKRKSKSMSINTRALTVAK